MIVWFSGTGNSRYAAKVLADALGDALLDAGQMIKKGRDEKLYSERPWVFVAPTYAWRMARILEDYIRRTELCGSRDAYFVLTCGGDIGNAGKYVAELCRDKDLSY
ncbi:MAG: flavodoxin family protein, partial [Oscillospiraceae bacterium]|nr:flavodoxin family protein [Oscillospiraceae bacterium]